MSAEPQPTLLFSVTNSVVVAGEPASVMLNVLNSTQRALSWNAPSEIDGILRNANATASVTLKMDSPKREEILPGAFSTFTYRFVVPASFSGETIVEFPELSPSKLLLVAEVRKTQQDMGTNQVRTTRWWRDGDADGSSKAFDPARFFKEHISGYEPFYFVAGTKSPNAKFQISFKYQLLNRNSRLTDKFPSLEGIHIAYTQTSLWDWNAPSAPFFDSSYKPVLMYAWDDVFEEKNWESFRLDLEFGLQHESNGRDGAASRSLNKAYLRPTFVFGEENDLQLTLQPRAWFYVGDLENNPDLADYQGYADLRTIIGWRRGLQLSALGRMGTSAEHGSVQLDLTYPMMRVLYSNFSLYLHLQYFTGYGESLLHYNERSSALRVGFSMYR